MSLDLIFSRNLVAIIKAKNHNILTLNISTILSWGKRESSFLVVVPVGRSSEASQTPYTTLFYPPFFSLFGYAATTFS